MRTAQSINNQLNFISRDPCLDETEGLITGSSTVILDHPTGEFMLTKRSHDQLTAIYVYLIYLLSWFEDC